MTTQTELAERIGGDADQVRDILAQLRSTSDENRVRANTLERLLALRAARTPGEAIRARYDKAADVLYVTFDERPAGRGFEKQCTVVVRASEDGSQLYGLTILDACNLSCRAPAEAERNAVIEKLAITWRDKAKAYRSSVSGGDGNEPEWYWADILDSCATEVRALTRPAAVESGKPIIGEQPKTIPNPLYCETCQGRGYLVGDAEWEPYAVQCEDCKERRMATFTRPASGEGGASSDRIAGHHSLAGSRDVESPLNYSAPQTIAPTTLSAEADEAARGWAIVNNGKILIRTVSDTRGAAIAIWLVIEQMLPLLLNDTDKSIERSWQRLKGSAEVIEVSVGRYLAFVREGK